MIDASNRAGDAGDSAETTPGAASVDPWRVGLILDGAIQPRWIAHALSLLCASPIAEIVLVAYTPPPVADRAHRLARLFLAADQKVFRRQPDPLEPTPISELIGNVETIVLARSGAVDDVARAQFRDAALDVVLCLGALEIGRQLVVTARHGVWYYPELVSASGIDRPVGFDATIAGVPAMETSLSTLTPEGTRGRSRYRSVSAVNRFFPHYTARRLLWKMATYPVRALATLSAGKHGGEGGLPEDVPLSPPPGSPPLLGTVTRIGYRLAKQTVRTALFRTEWTLAYRRDDTLSLETLTRRNPPGTYALIENPPDRFWADPFPVTDGDNHWLFVEEFPHRANRAHLSVMELRNDGSLGPSTPILSCPYHLSYPFVFQWRGDWYMVPETLDNRAVDLYRSTRFPHEWTHEQRLLDGVSAVDATLVEIDRRWWMFTSIAPYGGSENDELHIFHADSPLGPWTPHPRNPQVSDVRRARPAGRIFQMDGAWYRPAQDCSRRYGYAMTLNRITALSASEFAETCVARIEPTWARGLLGTHTVNHAGGITFVDGNRRRPRFSLRSRQ